MDLICRLGCNTCRLSLKILKLVGWVEERSRPGGAERLTQQATEMLGFPKPQPNLQISKTYAVLGWVEEQNPTSDYGAKLNLTIKLYCPGLSGLPLSTDKSTNKGVVPTGKARGVSPDLVEVPKGVVTVEKADTGLNSIPLTCIGADTVKLTG
ncbi:MAG: hypothetical protein KME64_30725 [Scytonematopsis contorta HA4267-MV1]|nr:hypothetical protein [Scytonematopsis contorta HA4267-MV1]